MSPLLPPGIDNESIGKIADEVTKKWYQKPEMWLSIIAIILAIAALLKE
jgi:hypothetical protein